MIKKICLMLVLFISGFAVLPAYSYTLTTSDKVIVEAIIAKIEQKAQENGNHRLEKITNTLPIAAKKLETTKPKISAILSSVSDALQEKTSPVYLTTDDLQKNWLYIGSYEGKDYGVVRNGALSQLFPGKFGHNASVDPYKLEKIRNTGLGFSLNINYPNRAVGAIYVDGDDLFVSFVNRDDGLSFLNYVDLSLPYQGPHWSGERINTLYPKPSKELPFFIPTLVKDDVVVYIEVPCLGCGGLDSAEIADQHISVFQNFDRFVSENGPSQKHWILENAKILDIKQNANNQTIVEYVSGSKEKQSCTPNGMICAQGFEYVEKRETDVMTLILQ